MTDIVERLRIEARGTYPEGKYLIEIMRQAAAEIERLRREHEMMQASVELGAKEIERLREQVWGLTEFIKVQKEGVQKIRPLKEFIEELRARRIAQEPKP